MMTDKAGDKAATDTAGHPERRYSAARLFGMVEHNLYLALGGLLSVVALAALVHVAIDVVASLIAFNENGRLLVIMDHLLFVLMLVEILHTVNVSIRSGSLNAEPFLVVGLIASIRRVLVITLESSNAKNGVAGGSGSSELFHDSMVELGVLGVLILVMVISIFLLRRAREETEEERARRGKAPTGKAAT
jgi:uncharacterized membrane protein (DUF373 family)